ncbi:MAG: sigma-70 family RNA polymerase sigma factor [Phycisphaerales bacterium]
MSGNPSREAELLRRARRGDTAAFTALLDMWRPALERIARRLLSRHGRMGFDTGDLVQTTLLRAIQRLPEAQSDQFSPLLATMMRGLWIDKLREATARQRHEAEVAGARAGAEVPSPADAPAHDAENLRSATGPEDWSLLMMWKEGISYRAMGEALGISADAAKARLHRLLFRIRDAVR